MTWQWDENTPFYIFNVIHRQGFGVFCIDGNDFPVQLSIINHGKDSQWFYLHTSCHSMSNPQHLAHTIHVLCYTSVAALPSYNSQTRYALIQDTIWNQVSGIDKCHCLGQECTHTSTRWCIGSHQSWYICMPILLTDWELASSADTTRLMIDDRLAGGGKKDNSRAPCQDQSQGTRTIDQDSHEIACVIACLQKIGNGILCWTCL